MQPDYSSLLDGADVVEAQGTGMGVEPAGSGLQSDYSPLLGETDRELGESEGLVGGAEPASGGLAKGFALGLAQHVSNVRYLPPSAGRDALAAYVNAQVNAQVNAFCEMLALCGELEER